MFASPPDLCRYMALFEMAPPHTHNRAANFCYAAVFALGLLCASLGERLEELTSPPSEPP